MQAHTVCTLMSGSAGTFPSDLPLCLVILDWQLMALLSAPRIDRYSELNRNTLHATVTHFEQGLRADVVGLRHTPRNPNLEQNENNNLNPKKPVQQRRQSQRPSKQIEHAASTGGGHALR